MSTRTEFVIPHSEVIATHHLDLAAGEAARVWVMASEADTHKKVLVVAIGKRSRMPIVRIQSKCVYGETLGSVECDCRAQLEESFHRMVDRRSGILIHLDQEGRGQGLSAKARGYEVAERLGIDTFGAYDELGLQHDVRSYDDAVRVLRLLKIHQCVLLTNNPAKVKALADGEITVHREPLWVGSSRAHEGYLAAKLAEGHLL